ncbi:hypothetical protein BH11MYX1_BH11MYX1_07070 [soil metagenome]
MHVEIIPESGLDAVLLQELYPRTDADDTQLEIDLSDLAHDDEYAAYELASDETTGTFVRLRDTNHDHLVTVEFPLAALDAETQPVECEEPALETPVRRVARGSAAPSFGAPADPAPLYSSPFARLDITPSFEDVLPFPVESLPFERVELDLIDPPKPPRSETETIQRGSSIVTVIAVLTCALALGLSAVLLLAR